jgi:exopolyphosphatase/guanosine-5'-triphosphate,3'-diphosphate pyrophosphatase
LKPNRVASIDIGTNTVLLLIAEPDSDKKPVRIAEHYAVARLGENVDKTGFISEEAIIRTSEILTEIKNICIDFEVEKILVAGTSALRDAKNSEFVINQFSSILDCEINIIGGEKEAALSFVGSVTGDKQSLVIDIGGGSTELITGKNTIISEKVSMQTGAVRITEKYFKNQHPPEYRLITLAKEDILNQIQGSGFVGKFEKVFAVAGTATTLATTALGLADYQVDEVNGYVLKNSDLNRIFDLYLSMNVNDIVKKLRVHPKRADLILAGSLIMNTIIEHFLIKELVVSSHGLRYGIIIDYFNNPTNW